MRINFRCNGIVSLLLSLLFLYTAGCGGKQPQQQKSSGPEEKGKPTVVSLAPSLTEMIYAIGAGKQLVGRTTACDWPKEAASVPLVGAFAEPSLEVLAAIHPDVVIDVDLSEKETGNKIAALGIRRETIQCRTPDDIPPALRKLGRLTGHAREADSLALIISNGLAGFRQKAAGEKNRKKVYLEIWDDPFWTGGKGSYTSALIAYAGGYNIGDAVEKEYFQISQEWVIEQNPDIIACMYMSKNSSAVGNVMNRQGWSHIGAVKQNRVYDRFDNNIFLRPGPRVLEGIKQLSDLLHRDEKHAPDR